MDIETKKGWQYFIALVGTPIIASIIYIIVAQYIDIMCNIPNEWFYPLLYIVSCICELVAVVALFCFIQLAKFYENNRTAKCIAILMCIAITPYYLNCLWNYSDSWGIRYLDNDEQSIIIYIITCCIYCTIVLGAAAYILISIFRNYNFKKFKIMIKKLLQIIAAIIISIAFTSLSYMLIFQYVVYLASLSDGWFISHVFFLCSPISSMLAVAVLMIGSSIIHATCKGCKSAKYTSSVLFLLIGIINIILMWNAQEQWGWRIIITMLYTTFLYAIMTIGSSIKIIIDALDDKQQSTTI